MIEPPAVEELRALIREYGDLQVVQMTMDRAITLLSWIDHLKKSGGVDGRADTRH